MTMVAFPAAPLPSTLEPGDQELLVLHRTLPEAWLFLGEVMAAAVPHLAELGLQPAGDGLAVSVMQSLHLGHCLALELRLREHAAGRDSSDEFSLVFRAGIYLAHEEGSPYWYHTLMLWACPPVEADDSWPDTLTNVNYGALRLAGELEPRDRLVGKAALVRATAALKEKMTQFGSTLEGLCSEFCYRMDEAIAP